MKQLGHQGDTQWYRLQSLPEKAKKVEKKFIAASERSGSMHALFGDYDMYEYEGGFVIDAKEDCLLNHSLQEHLDCSLSEIAILPEKDHEKSIIPAGVYFVGIQNRFNPLKGFLEKVKD